MPKPISMTTGLVLEKTVSKLIENYKCDGMWMDWWQMHTEASADIVMDFMKRKYPNIVLTYNNSIMWDLTHAHYLSYEAHNIKAAWHRANKYRKMKTTPEEAVQDVINTMDKYSTMDLNSDNAELNCDWGRATQRE